MDAVDLVSTVSWEIERLFVIAIHLDALETIIG